MRHALVVADTHLPRADLLARLAAEADYVLACDGGADRALDAGLDVDVVIGDLDGIQPTTLSGFVASKVVRDQDPDSTDLEKAMAYLAHRKVKRVTITGAIGGRLDHTLGTVAVLMAWADRFDVRVVDDDFTTTVVRASTKFRARAGTIVSLMAPQGARGVTTSGLRWDLRRHDLAFSSLGIHNEVRRSPVTIRVSHGPLLLLVGHDVRPHA